MSGYNIFFPATTLWYIPFTRFQNIHRCTWHISVMVSSNTPPASSAPSPTSFTFQAREGKRRSDAFSFTTCLAIWTKMGLHFRPLWGKRDSHKCNSQSCKDSEWLNQQSCPERAQNAKTEGDVWISVCTRGVTQGLWEQHWPGGDPFHSDLGPIVLALHHGFAYGAHHGQGVHPRCQQGPQLALHYPPRSSIIMRCTVLQ